MPSIFAMSLGQSLQFSCELGLCKNRDHYKQTKCAIGQDKLLMLGAAKLSFSSRQNFWGSQLSDTVYKPKYFLPYKYNVLKCHSSLLPGGRPIELPFVIKTAAVKLTRSYDIIRGNPSTAKIIPAVAVLLFAIWGIGPLLRQSRNLLFDRNDNNWKKSGTYYVMTSYLQPLLLWVGATLICSSLEPIILPTAVSQVIKQRLLNFVRSLSTVMAFAYCLSSLIQQAQKFFMETNESSDTRNMGFQFAGKAVYTAVWVAAVSLFMELLGFSTQKWLTAGGLGTVLLTLAGREIFTNFLSSAMIHATRPFVVNEWIQTKIEGYEVSGTVEHVGWWSPTIVRGEDREAVHIPNHKFTVNVVRNLSQKTHWRIKTHLAISHLDVNKINNIVADMRKVLAKNPQVEHKRLHRRVFLENVNPENQALLILISCFVKTSHFEEYLCVKEAILLDLLRVISHHRARLATPIRTVQKIYSETELESIPYADSRFNRGGVASNRPLLMIEPPYRINGEDKMRNQNRPVRTTSDANIEKAKQAPQSDDKGNSKNRDSPDSTSKEDSKVGAETSPDTLSNQATVKSISAKHISKTDSKAQEMGVSDVKATENSAKKATDVGKNRPTIKSDTAAIPSAEANVGNPAKSDGDKLRVAQAPSSMPALEENIVLGVALEGSKRTLPIEEEDMASTPAEAKDLASCLNGNGHTASEKDKKEDQTKASSSSGD